MKTSSRQKLAGAIYKVTGKQKLLQSETSRIWSEKNALSDLYIDRNLVNSEETIGKKLQTIVITKMSYSIIVSFGFEKQIMCST